MNSVARSANELISKYYVIFSEIFKNKPFNESAEKIYQCSLKCAIQSVTELIENTSDITAFLDHWQAVKTELEKALKEAQK